MNKDEQDWEAALKRTMKQVEWPSDTQVEQMRIRSIASGMPQSRTFWKAMHQLHHQLGWRVLLRDWPYALLLLVAGTAAISFMMWALAVNGQGAPAVYLLIMLGSPLQFLLCTALLILNDRSEGLADVEMTCKFHPYQLAAYRMLLASICTVVINSVMLVVLRDLMTMITFWSALLMSACAQTLFAAGLLYVWLKFRHTAVNYCYLAGWSLLHLGLFTWLGERYEQLWSELPLYVYGLVMVGAVALYGRNIKAIFRLRAPMR